MEQQRNKKKIYAAQESLITVQNENKMLIGRNDY